MTRRAIALAALAVSIVAIAILLSKFRATTPSGSVPLPGQAGKAASAGQANPAHAPGNAAGLKRGRELAQIYCTTCHLFPEPADLDRFTWAMETLPKMSSWLGLTPFRFEDEEEARIVREAEVLPTQPLLPREDWQAICNYYIEGAPVELPRADKPLVRLGLKQFRVIRPLFHRERPMTTLVKIDAAAHKLYLGDASAKTLEVLSAGGKLQASLKMPSPPVALDIRSNGLYATLIGNFGQSDVPRGSFLFLDKPKDGPIHKVELLNNLPRPAHTAFADLNSDAKEDFVVSGFGQVLGRFSWFENLGSNSYREHVLYNRPGATMSIVHDFNRDGRPDLLVLMAQAREGIYILMNKGNGEFDEVPVVEKPPSWGFSHVELVDFNGDGFVDILATNGDNGDTHTYAAPLKPYHGIRLYLNDGKNHFREAFFYPLNGAYKAVAADFSGKGRLDIAAVSFFPDFTKVPNEGFVYLENKGRLQFEAYTFPDAMAGRWMTMDVGDLDGDGAPDIVLGAFKSHFKDVPDALAERWETEGLPFIILKNIRTE